jgi:hypothetical protein
VCGFVAQSLIFCVGVYGPLLIFLFACLSLYCYVTARRGHARMVVGFTTTYAISAYHHWCLWVRNSIRTRCTTCDELCQWLATGLLFSPGLPVSFTNKTVMINNCTIIIKRNNHLSPTNTREHTSCNSMYKSKKLQIRNFSLYLINFFIF